MQGGQRRVLVVEDDADTLEVLAMALEETGHAVAIARDGAEALGRLAAFAPDVILLDLWMPRLGGEEFLAELRRDPVHHATPVVIVTGVLFVPPSAVLAADAIVRKPFEMSDLLSEIERLGEGPARPERLAAPART